MLTESMNNSSGVKTLQSDVPQLTKADAAKPVAEAFSGSVEIVERFAHEWRELCAEGPCDQPFFRPEWIEAYMRAFAPGKSMLVITARVNGRLRALLPLIQGWGLFHGLPVRMLRGPANDHSCRFDLAHGAGEDVPSAVRAIWRLLRENRGWDLIELGMTPDGGASESLLLHARSDGHLTGQWEMSPSPYITVPEQATTLEMAMKHTSSNFRSSLRRRRRKLEAEGELRFIRATEADLAELERFYQLEASGWKGKEKTAIVCHAETRKFYDEIARSAAQFGYLWLYRLECGDRTVAMQFNLNCGARYFGLKSAYDENFHQFSLGHILLQEFLREMLARGAKELDMMPPESEWKNKWATAARPHSYCYIFARGFVGRALHAYKFRLRPVIRRMRYKRSGTISETGRED
jgi:CelD/BcsL family acetyltransferase involved in cellulose biosynthesis